MRASDVERWEAMARQPRPPRRRWRGSLVASITSALLVVATLALAEDAPPEETAPTATETPTPEPSVAPEGESAAPEHWPSADPAAESSPDPEPSTEPEPTAEAPTAAESVASVPAPSGPPTIASDQADYPPGGTVTLTGSNWQPGEVVHIRVNDDAGESWRRDVDIVADANGVITDVFQLPDWFVATYTVTATGPLSGTATTTFTDSNVRFLTNAGGPTLTAIAWQLYSNSNCTTAVTGSGTSGTGTISSADGITLNVVVAGGQFVGLTVPATESGQDFVNWTRTSGNAASTTLAPGNRKICVAGEGNNSLSRFTANYIANVNDAPDAVNDVATVAEDSGANSIDVLANDTDADADTLAITDRTNGAHGAATIGVGGTEVTYTPDPDYFGPDSFTYTISDGNGGTDSATVTVTVTAVNDAPDAVGESAEFAEDSVDNVISVLANDSTGPPNESGQTLTIIEVPDPAHGTATIGVGGTEVTYTPDPDYFGPDSFTYKVRDNGTTNGVADPLRDTATVTITVDPVNDAPVAVDDSNSTDEDIAVETDVIANDTDVDTANADLEVDPASISATNGTATLLADGRTIRFTPAADLNDDTVDADGFTVTYRATDGTLVSNEATLTITVDPVNDAPVVDSAAFGVSSVGCPTTTGGMNATLAVSFHDVDLGDSHTAAIDWDGNPTTLGDNQSIGSVTSPFGVGHSYSSVGTYTARVIVSDGSQSDTATATITVNYTTSGILQPVNWTQAHNDPSIFKYGSTIPVKVQFFNCDGTNAGSGLSVKIEVKKLNGTTPAGGDNEVITNTNSPDSGGFMRWSAPQYLYNLNTKSLSDSTATYEITLTVMSTGQKVTTLFGTRAK